VRPSSRRRAAGTITTVLFSVGLALHVASLLAALASVVLRFRAARGVERQQLRWVAAGAGAGGPAFQPAPL
jgi:hypothetical protein